MAMGFDSASNSSLGLCSRGGLCSPRQGRIIDRWSKSKPQLGGPAVALLRIAEQRPDVSAQWS